MAIKMRNSKKSDAVCCNCGEHRSEVLNMFDLCIADNVFTICDRCNELILNKCVNAEVMKNRRTKSPHDMNIIRRRKNPDMYK